MKNLSFLWKAVVVSVLGLSAVSCYDDSLLMDKLDKFGDELGGVQDDLDGIQDDIDGIQGDLDDVYDKLYSLEDRLDAELSALKKLLAGQLFISKVSRDASTGIVTVTLSDGSTLQLLPPTDLKSTVTFVEIGGVNYWAYITADGKKELFKNEKGEGIPVEAETPEVIVEDGDYFIVIGGMKYPLGGNSVFSDYEVIQDEMTGEIYAVTFTFGEDMTFTVTVDGACGFYFVMAGGAFGQMNIIDEYFVPAGKTERIQVDQRGVIDYVLQVPAGWKVKEYKDVYTSETYFDITAPSSADVESGAADVEGDLKAVVVFEGGKATVSRLHLSSEPFKVLQVSMGKLYLEMNNGLQKYVCGVCPVNEFDETSVFATASELLTQYDYPAGFSVESNDINGASPAEFAASQLEYGVEYVFWSIPALYYSTDDAAGYYLEEGTFETVVFKHHDVDFSVILEGYNDVEVEVLLAGVEDYYMGVVPKDDYMLIDVLYNLNNPGYYTAKTWTYGLQPYTGSVFALAGVTPDPATDYVVWIALAGQDEYTENDLFICELSTITLVPGSSVVMSASEPVATSLNIVTELSAAGAEAIYYKYLTAADAKKYTDDAAKVDYLSLKGEVAKAENVTASLSESGISVKPETPYVLIAFASDSEGKYGNVLTIECSTSALTYNDLTVEVDIEINNPGNVVLNVNSEGAEELVYWIGRTADNTWKSPTYLGGTLESAQRYIYLNSTQYRITSVMEKYPIVDGQITMTDLTPSVEYVIVIMAKSSDGSFSRATMLTFEPSPVAIGKVVLSTDPKWEEARPTVEWIKEYFQAGGSLSGAYGYKITIPMNYTAYVLSGSDSYLNMGDNTLVLTPEQEILTIIEYVDHPRDWHLTLSDDWIWPYQGYEHYHSEHGAPLWGNSVIWASMEFHDSVCNCGGNFVETMQYEVKDEQGNKTYYNYDVTHLININEGQPFEFRMPQATGSTQEVIDRIFVVCQDLEGNCYEPFKIDVPVEYFIEAGQKQ